MSAVIQDRSEAVLQCRELAEALRPILSRLNIMLRRDASNLTLTPSQTTVLTLLLEEPQRMTDLSSHIGVKGPSMTVLVDRMEKQGWVRRLADPEDRRSVRVEITPEGRAAIDEVQASRTASLANRLAELSHDERAAIAAALPAIAALTHR